MKKTVLKVVSVALLMACLVMTFVACSDESKLVGEWYDSKSEGEGYLFKFNSDGTCDVVGHQGTYVVHELEKEPSYISADFDFMIATIYYEFEDSDTMKVRLLFNNKQIGTMTLIKK